MHMQVALLKSTGGNAERLPVALQPGAGRPGVAMVTALASLLTGRAADPDVAMTGEITLRGKVLPVGGIKEKVLAARRAGIHRVVLPEKNRRDVEEIQPELLDGLSFSYIGRIADALECILPPEPPGA